MREIKFRCKNKVGNWCFFTVLHNGNVNEENFYLETLSEFTGLLDKQGVEIYEGDIVNMFKDYIDKNTFTSMVRTEKFTISYNEKLASFVANPIGGLSPYNIINVEVIGNIYENHELLENKDEK